MKQTRFLKSFSWLLIFCLYFSLFMVPVQAQSLIASPSKIEIGPNKRITIKFSGAPGNRFDFIGLWKVGEEGEARRINGRFLDGKTSGTIVLNAPEEPGNYEFQMWESDWEKKLATSNPISVDWGKVDLSQTIGTHYIGPGKKIQVSFINAPGYKTDSIVLREIGKTENIDSQWLLTKTSGTLEFAAPEKPGSYEFVIWGNNFTKFLAKSSPFTVKWHPVSMNVSIGSTDAKGNGKLSIQYSGAPGYQYDYIGLYKIGEVDYTAYQWLHHKTSGTIELMCPTDTDSYEIRLRAQNENNFKTLLAKTQAFIPKNGPPPPVDQGPDDLPPTPTPSIDKPFILRAYPGDGKVLLEWTPPQNNSNVIGYNLYRNASSITSGSLINDFPIKGLKHIDENVDNGMKACYYMKAVYGDKTESSSSNEVCVFPNVPKAVINIPANATTKQSNYIFTGLVPPESNITVNGVAVMVRLDGSFTATVKINPGKNILAIIIDTKTGGIISSTHNVTLTSGDSKITILLTIGSNNAYVNQQLVLLDVAPFIDSGRTFVPFYFISESLRAELDYTVDASGKVATVTYILGITNITLYIGKLEATVNGKTVTLEVAPKIIKGRAVIPLRFVTEALGCKVEWDGEKMQVTIVYPA